MTHTIITALLAANWHFCMYGALAGILFLRAFGAWRKCSHHEVREHSIEGLIHAILAMLHL